MHILILSWEYPPHVVGGLGEHVAALVPALARQGAQVTLVTPRWRGGAAEERVGAALVYRVEPPGAKIGNFYADVQQTNLNLQAAGHVLWSGDGAGQRAGFDVIHAHDWLVAFAAAALKQLHKTPLVATMHATQRGRGRGQLRDETAVAINSAERQLAYEAWRVITTSQFMAGEVEDYFQLPADKIDVVPNGVDVSRFDALEKTDLAEFRARWASPDERIIFFIGRVQQEKGVHLLVEAAPRVLAAMPQAKFVIAGGGDMVEQQRWRARQLGLADKISLPGFVSNGDRDCLFKVADVAVFPSLYEPFGIVALEAMAAQCPLVASQVGGLRQVLTHGETGLLIYPDNLDSLVWGILETLRHPEISAARAANAYRFVCGEYSWDRIAQRTLEIYERVLRERAGIVW